MQKNLIVLALMCLILNGTQAQDRFSIEQIPSRFLSPPRTVRIYLPASYAIEPTRRYPVLYVHDGQNAFSTAGTNVAFGWGNWELDKTVDKLSQAGKMREIIVVAIDNSSARYDEYSGSPNRENSHTNTPFENYTAFLIEELKPR